MLNHELLIKFIKDPGLLSSQSLRDIQLLTDQYPYFQTARLLEIKNFHMTDSSGFQSKLNFSAAYIADRRILYELINPMEPATDETHTEKVEKERKPTLKDNIAEALTAQLHMTSSLNPEEAELIPNLALDLEKEYGSPAVSETNENPAETDNEIIWLDDIEAGPLVYAAHDDPDISAGKEEALIDLDEGESFTAGSPPQVIAEGKSPEQDILPEPETMTGDFAGPEGKETDTATSMVTEHQAPDIVSKKAQTHGENEESDDVTAEEPESYKSSAVSKNELIDRFIENNPRISPATGNITQIDVSAESVMENEGFLTDTLAKIYIKQGYYDKAVFAYEKLLLKFPEKSAYFAAQIEAIKKIMNKQD
jgi:tetratricopeptide (TPR) repeat protein